MAKAGDSPPSPPAARTFDAAGLATPIPGYPRSSDRARTRPGARNRAVPPQFRPCSDCGGPTTRAVLCPICEAKRDLKIAGELPAVADCGRGTVGVQSRPRCTVRDAEDAHPGGGDRAASRAPARPEGGRDDHGAQPSSAPGLPITGKGRDGVPLARASAQGAAVGWTDPTAAAKVAAPPSGTPA